MLPSAEASCEPIHAPWAPCLGVDSCGRLVGGGRSSGASFRSKWRRKRVGWPEKQRNASLFRSEAGAPRPLLHTASRWFCLTRAYGVLIGLRSLVV